MKNVFTLLFAIILFDSCVTKEEDKLLEQKNDDTIQHKIQMIESGGIILPDNRDKL
ncbi:hypothetical protein [uncultured Flavobacterium sp.]|uniref:hypothetical protein n=1 Tax=uncultured Flavobacterium sp. TaxID=165435 RepID=UPI0030C81786